MPEKRSDEEFFEYLIPQVVPEEHASKERLKRVVLKRLCQGLRRKKLTPKGISGFFSRMAEQIINEKDKRYLRPLCDKEYLQKVLKGEEPLTLGIFCQLNFSCLDVDESRYIPLKEIPDDKYMELYEQLKKQIRLTTNMSPTPKITRSEIGSRLVEYCLS